MTTASRHVDFVDNEGNSHGHTQPRAGAFGSGFLWTVFFICWMLVLGTIVAAVVTVVLALWALVWVVTAVAKLCGAHDLAWPLPSKMRERRLTK